MAKEEIILSYLEGSRLQRLRPKVSHLLLLVGGNPLPNAIAGSVLISPGGTVSLIHSTATAPLAQRLKRFLELKVAGDERRVRVRLKEIDPAEPCSIALGVREALDAGPADTVGLNYTGGTKAMAVHAHQAVREWVQKRGARAVLSYLDARTLQMIFDPPDPASGAPGSRVPLGDFTGVEFSELLGLHGWKLRNTPSETPFLLQSARALAQALADPNRGKKALEDLDGWRKDELEKRCRRKDKPGKWKSITELQSVDLPLPAGRELEPFVRCLRNEVGVSSACVPLGEAASRCRWRKPEDLCDWLHGKWLESLALQGLLDSRDRCALRDVMMNVEPLADDGNEVQFEIDVLAMRGYQLFALSCSTASKKDILKLKLFEAAHRARQLGGDEACVGLICCAERPDAVEKEMSSVFGSDGEGRIRVFGRTDLADLSGRLSEWILSQSGREG